MLSLRRAHLDDHWKTAFKRDYSVSLQAATFGDGKIFDGLQVEFQPGITALVGRNGVGKSNLIRSLFNLFATDASNRERFQTPLLDGGRIAARIIVENQTTLREYPDQGGAESHPDAVGLMYDPCTLIPSIQNLFVSQDNLEELLESYSAVTFETDELKLINFLTNGEYTSVSVVSIEDEFERFPQIPFFAVKTHDAQYDSRNMGLGELSLFYFFWLRRYLQKLEGRKILFIEEPESFLPPTTQERLADILAMTASIEGVSIILSSHSEHILKRVPRSHILVMKKTENHTVCTPAVSNDEPMRLLGLSSSKSGMILSEDIAAETLIKALLRSSIKYSNESFYYHISGSDGQILKDLLQFPERVDEFFFIGVFDGDCIGKYEKKLAKKTNYCFLPQLVAPEIFLIEFIRSASARDLAEVLAVSRASLIDAKQAVAGSDHHDYFPELARQLKRGVLDVLARICEFWIATNRAKAAEFLAAFEKCLKIS